MLAEAASIPYFQRFCDLAVLAKPRLSSLVLLTAAGGMWLAPGGLPAGAALVSLLAISGVVAAANIFNCCLECDSDGRMHRTQQRPLPAGRMETRTAAITGAILTLVCIPMLWAASNGLTALLGAVALISYVGFYTPLKRYSTLALFVGAVPGALPPLMGWTAVTGTVDVGGIALFALMFVWQLPHFLAISMYLRADYSRGGMKVFSLVHGARATKAWTVATTIVLIPVSLWFVPLGVASPWYMVPALLLGAGFLGLVLKDVRKGQNTRWARQAFVGSLGYLTLLFAALAVSAA